MGVGGGSRGRGLCRGEVVGIGGSICWIVDAEEVVKSRALTTFLVIGNSTRRIASSSSTHFTAL